MDMLQQRTPAPANAFDLKNSQANLIPQSHRSESVHLTLQALEAMRTDRRVVPASKHGLETICGASCETGAQ